MILIIFTKRQQGKPNSGNAGYRLG